VRILHPPKKKKLILEPQGRLVYLTFVSALVSYPPMSGLAVKVKYSLQLIFTLEPRHMSSAINKC